MRRWLPPPWLLSGLLCLFFSAYALLALDFSPTARIAPLAFSLPGGLLAFLQFYSDLTRTPPAAGDQTTAPGARGVLLWLAGLVAAAIFLGLLPGCWLFIAAWLRLRERRGLGFALTVASVFCGTAYLLFDVLLGLSLHTGLLTAGIWQ
jgi:hypothetical protein